MNTAWHLASWSSGKDSEKFRDSEMTGASLPVENTSGSAEVKERAGGG